MVRIEREDTNFIFEVVGWHKLWTFTNRLVIPMAHIVDAFPNEKPLDFIPGIRLMEQVFLALFQRVRIGSKII